MNSELGQTFPPPSPIDPLLRPRDVQRDGQTPRPTRPSRPSGRHRRRGKRLNGAVLTIASVVGVWFGIAAPAISPVAPQPAAAAVAPGSVAPASVAPASVAPTSVVPTTVAPVAVAAAPVTVAPVTVAHEVAVAAVVTRQARHGHDGHR